MDTTHHVLCAMTPGHLVASCSNERFVAATRSLLLIGIAILTTSIWVNTVRWKQCYLGLHTYAYCSCVSEHYTEHYMIGETSVEFTLSS